MDNLLTSVIIVLLVIVVYNSCSLKLTCNKPVMPIMKVYQPDAVPVKTKPVPPPSEEKKESFMEGMQDKEQEEDYSEVMIKQAGLEDAIKSHNSYMNESEFAGLPTTSSRDIILEENRDATANNWIGLTKRKLCKARTWAVPDKHAREQPSYLSKACGTFSEDCLI